MMKSMLNKLVQKFKFERKMNMCGIVGYFGSKQASPILVAGLSKLEYRGYDSAGVAIIDNGVLSVTKCKGKLAKIPVELDIASEFKYRDPIMDKNTLMIVISQSGETADTMSALRLAKSK